MNPRLCTVFVAGGFFRAYANDHAAALAAADCGAALAELGDSDITGRCEHDATDSCEWIMTDMVAAPAARPMNTDN